MDSDRIRKGFEWTPESTPPKPDSGASIFTAVQEELGLRLRSQKAPIEVLLVDRAERPVGN